jgi:hypothetical protein
MKIFDAFQILVCAFSAAAAILWIKSSAIKLPDLDIKTWEGKGPFLDAVKRQSRWSAGAAKCAAMAAAFQALDIARVFLNQN